MIDNIRSGSPHKAASKHQIRAMYKRMGYDVRIDSSGRVHFRIFNHPDMAWRDGRFVSEYRVTEEGQVYLP